MAQFPMFALLLISSAILFQISLANDSAKTESRRTRQYPSWPILLNRPFYMNPWSRSFYPYYSSYYSDVPATAWNEESEPNPRWRNGQVDSRQDVLSSVNNALSPLTDAVKLNFDTCVDSNGRTGNCVPAFACLLYRGRPEGSCGAGRTCCFHSTNQCGGSVTQNNTYWQSPVLINNDSTCTKTITLDQNLVEQWRKPICQIRLDFLGFKLAQPGTNSQCLVDMFIVGGTSNKIPVLCGENIDAHMYLNVPPTKTEVQLLFSFGSFSRLRSWNIKIALLPCGADYLAPSDCLQYYTEKTGTFQSFNWKYLPATQGTHQLANQDYKICFRNQKVNPNGQIANKICYTPCVTTQAEARAFSLNGLYAAGAPSSSVGAGSCPKDFILIEDSELDVIPPAPTVKGDRYCGQQFNPTAGSAAPATVCSTVSPFYILYRTDATEDATESFNFGFCFTYEQRAV